MVLSPESFLTGASGSDILNATVVTGLIFAEDLTAIYLTACLSSLITTFRYPAQRALGPNLVEKDQIVLLNSSRASSESLILVIGSAVRGAAVGLLGVTNAFITDALTFLSSAAVIATISVNETHLKKITRKSQV